MENLTRGNFSLKTRPGKAVVDFWAPWCGPCKMQGPIFEELAGEIKDVNFFKVNVDEEQEVMQNAGIRGIPTMIFYKDGKEVGRHSGLMDKNALKAKIHQMLG